MATSYNRIVSLVPSLTELLVDLGLKEQLVGRTRFCVHPKGDIEDIPIIGGTKNPGLDKIRDLDPDYIVANREENKRAHIEELSADFKVKITDISTVEDALIVIHELGKTFEVTDRADQLIGEIQQEFDARPKEKSLSTAYMIWKKPLMTVGNDTYIHNILTHWNLENVFDDKTRYPKISTGELYQRSPDLILLSSEPYPFKEKHISIFEEACPGARTLLVNGGWFSWYGSHMKYAFSRLNAWRRAIS